jgi:hypothetical protein
MTTHQTSLGGLNMTNLLTQAVVPSEPSYRFIPLTQGQFAIVDAEDFDWLNQSKWYAQRYKRAFYAYRHNPKTKKPEPLHSVLLPPREGFIIDHENRLSLDNRRSNLRYVTLLVNCRNRSVPSTSKSGIIGVRFYAVTGKWKVSISVGGKERHLGYFANKEAAIAKRREAEQIHYGSTVIQALMPSPPTSLKAREFLSSTGHRNITKCRGQRGYFVTIRGRYIGFSLTLKGAVAIKKQAIAHPHCLGE